jgi:hypothetical protein
MPPTSLPGLVDHMAGIPTELICQVLDDLRYWDMLRLASYSNAKISGAIMSHITCSRIFEREMTNMTKTVEVFLLYSQICRLMRVRKLPPTLRLALSIGQDS